MANGWGQGLGCKLVAMVTISCLALGEMRYKLLPTEEWMVFGV
jgi:hypothetical protein